VILESVTIYEKTGDVDNEKNILSYNFCIIQGWNTARQYFSFGFAIYSFIE
jgi:hypothetical protein